jgi:hypothetical protein
VVEITSSGQEANTNHVSSQDEFGADEFGAALDESASIWRGGTETERILAHRGRCPSCVDLARSEQEEELLLPKRKSN